MTADSALLVNLQRPPLLAPLREGTVRDKTTALRNRGIGPPGWTPHWFRHTTAMQLLHAGADTTVIALWLGHVDVTTTRIYLDADLELKQQALDRTTPTPIAPGRYKPPDSLIAFLEGL